MEPSLPTGSLCVVTTRIDPGKIYKGDVIAFQTGSLEVAHRVVAEREGGYQTKGDNNDSPDPGIVRESQVIGKVLFHVPYIGYVAAWLQSLL